MTQSVFFEAWGFTLVHFCWQAMLLAGLYKLADLAFAKLRHSSRYVMALATLMAMAAAAAGTFVYEVIRLSPDATTAQTLPAAATLLPAIAPDTVLTLRGILPWLDAAWLLGVLALTARTLAGLYMIHSLKKAAQPVPESLANRFSWALRRLGLTGKVRLRLHPGITGPFVIGAMRSIIYLPVSAVTSLTPEQLDAVLAHELEHIRRADYAWNLVQNVIETLFFFHPAVWWLGSVLREQRELCCDDAALKTCDDPLTYATALLTLEQQRRAPRTVARTLVVALNGQGEGKSLIGRIARMLGEKATLPRSKARPHAALALPVLLLVLGAFITPVAQVAASAADHNETETLASGSDEYPIGEKTAKADRTSNTALADEEGRSEHRSRTLTSDDGDWQAQFDSIDPDAIAAQIRADLMQAKADAREAHDIDPDAIAAEVRADMVRTKADLERQGIMDHGIDPDAIAAQVRADTMKARAEVARLDSIDVDAMAEQARRDAQRAKDQMERTHRMTPPTPPSPPEAWSGDEVPAPLAEPEAPSPVPAVSAVPPAPPAAPVKVKIKVAKAIKVKPVKVMALAAADVHTNVSLQVSPHTVIVTRP